MSAQRTLSALLQLLDRLESTTEDAFRWIGWLLSNEGWLRSLRLLVGLEHLDRWSYSEFFLFSSSHGSGLSLVRSYDRFGYRALSGILPPVETTRGAERSILPGERSFVPESRRRSGAHLTDPRFASRRIWRKDRHRRRDCSRA